MRNKLDEDIKKKSGDEAFLKNREPEGKVLFAHGPLELTFRSREATWETGLWYDDNKYYFKATPNPAVVSCNGYLDIYRQEDSSLSAYLDIRNQSNQRPKFIYD